MEEWRRAQMAQGLDPDAILKSFGDKANWDSRTSKRVKPFEMFVSHVENVPDRADMERLVVEARKQELLKKYMDTS
jgi:DNA primase